MKIEAICLVIIAVCLGLLIWGSVPKTKIRVIDGCEYIAETGYRIHTLTHKGNCTNSIHAR